MDLCPETRQYAQNTDAILSFVQIGGSLGKQGFNLLKSPKAVQTLLKPKPSSGFSLAEKKFRPIYSLDEVNKIEKVAAAGFNWDPVTSVIRETPRRTGDFLSNYRLSTDQALKAGLKFLGSEYKEIGKNQGIFRSLDGLRQFRMDSTSLRGLHDPKIPHIHFEIFNLNKIKPEVLSNNHIPFYD